MNKITTGKLKLAQKENEQCQIPAQNTINIYTFWYEIQPQQSDNNYTYLFIPY